MDSSSKYIVLESHDSFEVVQLIEKNMKALISKANFSQGSIVSKFIKAEVFSEPSYLTVQSGVDEHIGLNPVYLQFTNHSCAPSIYIDTEKLLFIALRDIRPKDEITFFYPSTEWDMDRPFACSCGSEHCIGEIAGAKQTDSKNLSRYSLAPHILFLKNNESL